MNLAPTSFIFSTAGFQKRILYYLSETVLIPGAGGSKVIDVIDVARQADSKMKLSQFIKYFMAPHRPKVLNLISLEFSDTK